MALRAGTQHASNATSASSNAIATKVTGSVALTPKSRFFIVRVNASAAIKPKRNARECEFHSVTNHESEYVSTLRAERHAQSDFSRALRD